MKFDTRKTRIDKKIAKFNSNYPDGKRVFAWWPLTAYANEHNNNTNPKFVWLEYVIKTAIQGYGKNYYMGSNYTYIK